MNRYGLRNPRAKTFDRTELGSPASKYGLPATPAPVDAVDADQLAAEIVEVECRQRLAVVDPGIDRVAERREQSTRRRRTAARRRCARVRSTG